MRDAEQFRQHLPAAVLSAVRDGRVPVRKPGRLCRPGKNPVGLGEMDERAGRVPRQVPFGPSGLTLYESDLAFLERVRAGRAAKNSQGVPPCGT